MDEDAQSASGPKTIGGHLAQPLVVGEPDIAGPLAVYPVFGPPCEPRYIGATQANGSFEVAEAESASVRDLTVANHGRVDVLLYEGEEVLGGQQNRSVDISVLVAGGTSLTVPVSCVEAGRWDHSSHRAGFRSSSSAPYPALRRSKSSEVSRRLMAGREARADQGTVWADCDSAFAELGGSSPTRSLSDLYEQKDDELRGLEGAVRLRPHQVGALAAVDGRVCVLDVVGRPDVFAALHRPLVRGYGLEALGALRRQQGGAVRPAGVGAHQFVTEVLAAPAATRPSVGLGSDLRFADGGVTGSALIHDGHVIALTAFPDESAAAPTPVGTRTAGRIRRPSHRRPRA